MSGSGTWVILPPSVSRCSLAAPALVVAAVCVVAGCGNAAVELCYTVKQGGPDSVTCREVTFNRTNINASIAESIERFRPVVKGAHEAGLPVRGYVSMAFHCPYEGPIRPEAVRDVIRRLLELEVDDICPADTVGRASADDVRALLSLLRTECPADQLSLHFHDTYGHAVDNALTARREFDVPVFDGAAGGLGGCPYAEGAPGNVATEALVDAFRRAGEVVGVDAGVLRSAAHLVRSMAPGA